MPTPVETPASHRPAFLDINLSDQEKEDTMYVRQHLPEHYTVIGTINHNGFYINCQSKIGMDDGRNEDQWEAFKTKVRVHFKNRFREIFHNTCCRHMDFNIYLQQYSPKTTDNG